MKLPPQNENDKENKPDDKNQVTGAPAPSSSTKKPQTFEEGLASKFQKANQYNDDEDFAPIETYEDNENNENKSEKSEKSEKDDKKTTSNKIELTPDEEYIKAAKLALADVIKYSAQTTAAKNQAQQATTPEEAYQAMKLADGYLERAKEAAAIVEKNENEAKAILKKETEERRAKAAVITKEKEQAVKPVDFRDVLRNMPIPELHIKTKEEEDDDDSWEDEETSSKTKIKEDPRIAEAKAKAEAEAEDARIKAETEAEDARIKAEAEAEDARIKAETEAEDARIKAETEAEDARIKAEAEAKAKIKSKPNSIDPNRIQQLQNSLFANIPAKQNISEIMLQVKAALEQAEKNVKLAHDFVKAKENKNTNNISSTKQLIEPSIEQLKQYSKMLKAGIEANAVLQRMQKDGVKAVTDNTENLHSSIDKQIENIEKKIAPAALATEAEVVSPAPNTEEKIAPAALATKIEEVEVPPSPLKAVPIKAGPISVTAAPVEVTAVPIAAVPIKKAAELIKVAPVEEVAKPAAAAIEEAPAAKPAAAAIEEAPAAKPAAAAIEEAPATVAEASAAKPEEAAIEEAPAPKVEETEGS